MKFWNDLNWFGKSIVIAICLLIVLVFTVIAKAETETQNSCVVCIEKITVNHAKQQSELLKQCNNYNDLKHATLKLTLNSIVETSIADEFVQKITFDCNLYNEQLKKSFDYHAELKRK